MSSLLALMGGGRVVTALVGAPSIGGPMVLVAQKANAAAALSGAMTANTLKAALSVTGRGRVNWSGVWTNDATSRTVRVRVTRDGAVVRDFTSSAISTSGNGYSAIGGGQYDGSSNLPVFQPLDFDSSLLIEIASSLTETDKLTVAWNYEVHQ